MAPSAAPTDVDLVQRALAGDRAAVEMLHHRYAAFIVGQARRAGAGHDAEDVAQELFCRLVEGRGWHVRLEAGARDGTIYPLVAVMARRLAQGRRAAVHGPDPAPERDVVPLWTTAPETPDARLRRRERAARLQWAFDMLPPRLQHVAYLRYLDGLSGPAIAAQLGLRPGTIPSYFASIRARLRPALEVLFALPAAGRWGHVRLATRRDRPPTTGHMHYNAKRRRARARQARGRLG